VAAAKTVITRVLWTYFGMEHSLPEFTALVEEEKELQDVDQYQSIYAGDKGLFLVVLVDDCVVGTGAIRPITTEVAELKRLWLLEEYHGQKIGYQVVMRLFEFARQAGYSRICLSTSLEQKRAIAFYKRIGFVETDAYQGQLYDDDISMQIDLIK
jgi:putative acetyltransferase